MIRLIISAVLVASPCSYWDMLHYDRAQEYHEHAGAMHGYAEVAIENCPEAKGACAVHATELAKQSEIWAIKERAELMSISQACRDSLNDETEAR
jgi:hypothetical protein